MNNPVPPAAPEISVRVWRPSEPSSRPARDGSFDSCGRL